MCGLPVQCSIVSVEHPLCDRVECQGPNRVHQPQGEELHLAVALSERGLNKGEVVDRVLRRYQHKRISGWREGQSVRRD